MMAGRVPSWIRKVIRQQAQTYSAGGLLMVGIRTPRAVSARKRTQSTFHPRPVIYTDSTARQPISPHSGAVGGQWCAHARALAAPRARWRYGLRVPIRPASLTGLYTPLGGLSRGRCRALPVSVPGAPAVYRAATLAPARSRRAKHLDAGHHPVAQFHPELFQEAGAKEPQLGGPGS